MLVLVNNAGVRADGLAPQLGDERLGARARHEPHRRLPATRRALQPMLRARFGRIVNIASVVGPRANAGQANYAASKAGLIGLTKTVAVEVARRGVTVNAVAPGLIETELTDGDRQRPRSTRSPPAAPGRPEEVAACVALPRLRGRLVRDRDDADRRRRHERLTDQQTSNRKETRNANPSNHRERREGDHRRPGRARRRAREITREATFEELDVDSLDLVELAQIVEDEYGVELKGDDVKDLKTVGDVIELVVARARDDPPASSSPASAPSPRSGSARDALIERWSAGECGIADGVGALPRLRADRPPLAARRRGAPTASRSSRWSPPTRRSRRRLGGRARRTTPERIGCVIGTGIGGLGSLEQQQDVLREQGPKAVSPLAVPLLMANAAAAAVAMRNGLHGQLASASCRPARPGRTRSARRCG